MKTQLILGAVLGIVSLAHAASFAFKGASEPIEVPNGYTLLGEARGDLDQDGKAELVLVWDTGIEGELGTERELRIYRQQQKKWRLWHKSQGAVLPSQHGGMMGDPFEGVSVKNQAVVIDHFGGSRQKWSYTHRYRWQKGDWYLIGATVYFGAACDEQSFYDYNLSTGAMKIRINQDDCEEEALSHEKRYAYQLKRTVLPKMDAFYPGNNELVLPNKKLNFYY